jgi:hypothetical protein
VRIWFFTVRGQERADEMTRDTLAGVSLKPDARAKELITLAKPQFLDK